MKKFTAWLKDTALFLWLKKQNEFLPLIIGVVLWYYWPHLVHFIDPTAGSYDIGTLQLNVNAIISFCVAQAVVWMALKVNWPSLRQYFETKFIYNFKKELTPWQQTIVSLSVYFALLASFVMLNRVI